MSAMLDPWLSRPQAARYVLKVLAGDEYEPPGGFARQLIELCCKADLDNLNRLVVAFPNVGVAVHLYKYVSGGVEILRAWAEEPDEADR